MEKGIRQEKDELMKRLRMKEKRIILKESRTIDEYACFWCLSNAMKFKPMKNDSKKQSGKRLSVAFIQTHIQTLFCS